MSFRERPTPLLKRVSTERMPPCWGMFLLPNQRTFISRRDDQLHRSQHFQYKFPKHVSLLTDSLKGFAVMEDNDAKTASKFEAY